MPVSKFDAKDNIHEHVGILVFNIKLLLLKNKSYT